MKYPVVGHRITHFKGAVLACPLGWLGLGDEVTVVISQGGSTDRWLDTHQLGRDVLSRVIHGARMSLIVAAATLGNEEPLAWRWGPAADWYANWSMRWPCAWWTSGCHFLSSW